MKKIQFLALLVLLLLFSSCNAQNNNKKSDELSEKEPKPKVDFKVNKEYDENGNLIKYDSTYTSYYSNIKGDSKLRDSIFKQFQSQFGSQFKFTEDSFFKDFFYNDSIVNENFYGKDFFANQFMNNHKMMQHMFSEMDSIKNQFFKKQFIIPPESEPKKEN